MPTLCPCETPGPLYTGVPGVLAEMRDGRVAPGADIERCRRCRRYPNNFAALAALNARGLIPWKQAADGTRCFTVHCYAVVRVSLPGIIARNHKEAAAQVIDSFDWDVHGSSAEFADEVAELLVDGDQDGRIVRSQRFTPTLEEIES